MRSATTTSEARQELVSTDLFSDLVGQDFDCILADPPWSYGKSKPRKKSHRGGNPQSHYPTMSADEIKRLPVDSIAAKNSILFLWVTNPKLWIGGDVMDAWGFKYQTTITWVKTTQAGDVNKGGLGFYFRGATEHVLVGTRGKVSIPTHLREENVVLATKGRHSAKPTELMEKVERVTHGMKRVELFARLQREGWTSFGNQVERDLFSANAKSEEPRQ